METCSIVIVGVGGQGVLFLSEVLGQAAMESGLDVKVAEIHGMAQRGGSVVSTVRLGKKVHSPTVAEGEAITEIVAWVARIDLVASELVSDGSRCGSINSVAAQLSTYP